MKKKSILLLVLLSTVVACQEDKPVKFGAVLPLTGEASVYGEPIRKGVELAIELLDNGSGWVDVLDPVTDIQGQVSFTYYAGTITGPVRLRTFISSGLAYE